MNGKTMISPEPQCQAAAKFHLLEYPVWYGQEIAKTVRYFLKSLMTRCGRQLRPDFPHDFAVFEKSAA